MPPAKSKQTHDDPKSETPSLKDRNGHITKDTPHTNGSKLRRVASSTGSQLRDATINSPSMTATPAAVAQPANAPGIDWTAFDRDVLHDYRREHHLDTPSAFENTYHQIVLSRPGSVGLHSPTMARKREFKRQTREKLAQLCRRHFNGLGIQENEVVVNFLHKVKNPGITKPKRNKLAPHASPMP